MGFAGKQDWKGFSLPVASRVQLLKQNSKSTTTNNVFEFRIEMRISQLYLAFEIQKKPEGGKGMSTSSSSMFECNHQK